MFMIYTQIQSLYYDSDRNEKYRAAMLSGLKVCQKYIPNILELQLLCIIGNFA